MLTMGCFDTTCYQVIIFNTADRHLYGHLNPEQWTPIWTPNFSKPHIFLSYILFPLNSDPPEAYPPSFHPQNVR